MNCHNCEVSLSWDGISPIVVCELCRSYRCVDTPDETSNRIVSLNRPGRTHCPACRRRMVQAATDGLKVEHCSECRGVLLTDDLFAMFVRNRRSEFREAALQPVTVLRDQIETKLHCPNCRQPMCIHPCYGPNSVIVESCVDCGMVWLDCRDMSCDFTEASSAFTV
jgi:Zn-finger nucleic acid-binding protein